MNRLDWSQVEVNCSLLRVNLKWTFEGADGNDLAETSRIGIKAGRDISD